MIKLDVTGLRIPQYEDWGFVPVPKSEPFTVGSWRDDAEATDLPPAVKEILDRRDALKGDADQPAPVYGPTSRTPVLTLADGSRIYPAFFNRKNAWTFKGEDWHA